METTHWGGPGEDYRLSKISAAAISEDNGIGAPAPDDAAPVWQPPKAIHSFPWFEMVMTVIGVLGVIGLTLYMLTPEATGYFALVKTTLLALIPLVIVVGFLIRIDRWEPEPWKTKISVFLWGAGVATLSAGILNTALHHNIAYSTGDAQGASALSATFVAPLVEETLKGVVVLIVVLVRRTNINSVLDGVVYAGFSAAGFMFTEDILYFLRGEAEGTTNLIVLVVMRGIFSPFLHVMATSMTGIGLALALLKFKRRVLGVRHGDPLPVERQRLLRGRLVPDPLRRCSGARVHRVVRPAAARDTQGSGEDPHRPGSLRPYRLGPARRGYDGHRQAFP